MRKPHDPIRNPLPRRSVLAALVLLAGAACAPAPAAEGMEPVPAPPPSPAAPAPAAGEVRLVPVSRTRVADASPRALGLSGASKANPLEERLRRSVPAATPRWLPRTLDGMELFVADPTPDGWLAFYRDPLDRGAPGAVNARFRAVLYAADDAIRWSLDLGRFLSRPSHLEIQDIRYADGKLYFNEACQSYAREAGGRCSSLLRVDPLAERVEWRTPPLVSNDVFLLHGPHVIAAYGFTAEPDSLFVLDRESGRILARAGLETAHDYLEVKDGEVWVLTYGGTVHRFRMEEARTGG